MVVQWIWGGGNFNAAKKFKGSGDQTLHLQFDKTGLFMSVFQLGSYGVAPKVVVVAPEM